jgi:hypothetical protein
MIPAVSINVEKLADVYEDGSHVMIVGYWHPQPLKNTIK